MKVITYLSGNPVHDRVLNAFHNGIPVDLTITAETRHVSKGWAPADVAVVFGIGKKKVPVSWPRGKVCQGQLSTGKPLVVLETGYIHRGDGPDNHYAAGFNGLNGRADFRNQGVPGDRWNKLRVNIRGYRLFGQHILVCGQVPWDASVDHHDHLGWIRATVARLNNITGKPIIFRPHPLAQGVNYGLLKGATFSTKSLAEDLQDCHAVVTYNSNTGVDALLEGIPVFTDDDGSMVRAVSNHDIADIENPTQFDRAVWANDIAYTQWTPVEFERGLAWHHLFRPDRAIRI